MMKMARAAGALFMAATGAFMIGNGLLSPMLDRPDFLVGLYTDRAQVIAGLFAELVNAVSVVGIAMLLYPIIKKHNEAFALGYFGSRIIESALLIASLVGPLVLIALSESYIAADGSSRSTLQTIGNLAAEAHFTLFELAMIVLSLGSLLLCYVLYRARLVPRLLSVLGFIGYAALLASSCLTIAGLDTGGVLYIPGAIFEILFPIWLMVKGLKQRTEEV